MAWNERFTDSVNSVAVDIAAECEAIGLDVVECSAEDLAGGCWAFRLEWRGGVDTARDADQVLTLWIGPDDSERGEDELEGFYWQFGDGQETGPDTSYGAADGARGPSGLISGDDFEVGRVLTVGSEATRFARWIARMAS